MNQGLKVPVICWIHLADGEEYEVIDDDWTNNGADWENEGDNMEYGGS